MLFLPSSVEVGNQVMLMTVHEMLIVLLQRQSDAEFFDLIFSLNCKISCAIVRHT